MTIGIATRGPSAGRAALAMLRATEAIGAGSIGGFAVLRWQTADGQSGIATCQDEGSLGLAAALERRPDWAEARYAALISSGPNRPEPLSQFVAFDPASGFVTGHRLPTSPLPDGRAINAAAMAGMQAGQMDADALQSLLAQGPAMDAGLICLPWLGPVVMANAPRVQSRDDIGGFLHNSTEVACAVLHNSIHAASRQGDDLAHAVGEIGLAVLSGHPGRHHLAALPDRLEVRPAASDALEVDAAGRVIALHSADPAYFSARPRITGVYQSVPIYSDGQRIGQALSEVFVTLEPGWLIAGPRRHFVWASP